MKDGDIPPGSTEVPEEQLRKNAFAATSEPLFWPHVSLEWDDDRKRYELVVFRDDPLHDDTEMLRMNLVTLIEAEAEYSFDECRHLVSQSNAELREKATALRALADQLIQCHTRPELVGGTSKPMNG